MDRGARAVAEESVAEMPLIASRKVLDFAIVPQAWQQRQFFELQNVSDKPVEVDRIDTSCECLEVTLGKRRIGAGEIVLACASLDLALAADFAGKVEIAVKGVATDQNPVFAIAISADVRSVSDFESFAIELAQVADADPKPVPMPRLPDDKVNR